MDMNMDVRRKREMEIQEMADEWQLSTRETLIEILYILFNSTSFEEQLEETIATSTDGQLFNLYCSYFTTNNN